MSRRSRLYIPDPHPGAPWSRRDALLAGGAALGWLAAPRVVIAGPGDDLPAEVAGVAEAAQQAALVDSYWAELQGDSESQWTAFKQHAELQGKALDVGLPATVSYIDLAEELHAGKGESDPALAVAGPRAITLLPSRVEAVPVAIAKMSNTVTQASRFIMPFLSATPVGPAVAGAFKVLDVSFKAAAWFATSPAFAGHDRATVNPRLVPVAKAALAQWKSPKSGRSVEGAMHPSVLGQIFVAREQTIDEVTGFVGQVIGIRKSGAIADEGTIRMYLVKLLEA